jgi:hypothetical protein
VNIIRAFGRSSIERNAAAECGFDPQNPTRFNGDHKAGPLAMISTPDASTGLGPPALHAPRHVDQSRTLLAVSRRTAHPIRFSSSGVRRSAVAATFSSR